jgi:hypothetical protein
LGPARRGRQEEDELPLYRLEVTVDLQDLSDVLGSVTSAAGRHKLDPRITLSLIPEPPPDEAADIVHRLHPAPAPPKARKQKHVQNDGSWPAPGTIYSTVLEALGDGPKTPNELRDVLKARGFSPGSVNSALGRLEKNDKAKRTGSGSWTAV